MKTIRIDDLATAPWLSVDGLPDRYWEIRESREEGSHRLELHRIYPPRPRVHHPVIGVTHTIRDIPAIRSVLIYGTTRYEVVVDGFGEGTTMRLTAAGWTA